MCWLLFTHLAVLIGSLPSGPCQVYLIPLLWCHLPHLFVPLALLSIWPCCFSDCMPVQVPVSLSWLARVTHADCLPCGGAGIKYTEILCRSRMELHLTCLPRSPRVPGSQTQERLCSQMIQPMLLPKGQPSLSSRSELSAGPDMTVTVS